MKDIVEIKKELGIIRNYYDILRIFNGSTKIVMPEDTKQLVNEYEEIMKTVPSRINAIYIKLYKSGKRKSEIADELHRSLTFVKMLDKELQDYLEEYFKEI